MVDTFHPARGHPGGDGPTTRTTRPPGSPEDASGELASSASAGRRRSRTDDSLRGIIVRDRRYVESSARSG